jgi:hypothetical protein
MNKPPARLTLLAAIALVTCLLLLAPPDSTDAAEANAAGKDTPPAGPLPAPVYDEFIVIPLRIHVLTATDLPEIDCKLSDDDVRRIVGKVNRVVWQQAGIHFGIESIRREPAARQDDFRRWRELTGGHLPLDVYPMLRPGQDKSKDADAPADSPAAPAAAADPAGPASPAGAANTSPAEAPFEGLHVYYVHELPTNGVYFGDGFAFVKETASLRPVEGGIDEPIPRVTAHELGHALSLPHRQNWTNLMASGNSGTLLHAAEVAAARAAAGRLAGAAGMSTWRDRAAAAEEAGDTVTARRLWAWLADVPGDGAKNAAARRDRVKAKG